MPPLKITLRPAVSYEPIVRALAHFVLATSVLCIFFAALFPFDFHFPSTGLVHEIRRRFDSSPEPAVIQDRIQNVLFFVPFGLGLAASIRPKRGRAIAVRLIGALVLGAALSLTVETFQCFLGYRDPTWMDVAMNTTGSVIGAAIVTFGVNRDIEGSVARPFARLRPHATFRNVTVLLVLYTVAQLVIPFRAGNRGLLDNWDVNFPLIVGNEAGGDRGWVGRVWQVDLASRAATVDEVRQVYHAGNARDAMRDSLLASYRCVGDGSFPDAAGLNKPFAWSNEPPRDDPPVTGPSTSPTSQPAQVSLDRWLRTTGALAPAIHRIRGTSQFTLATTVAPDDAYQTGPARIVSISGGIYRRNVSIMHDAHDLAIRVRTPLLGDDGSAPQCLLEDVFETTDRRHVVVTYANPLLVVYVDGAERGRMEITPEAEFIWRMYPRSGWRVRLGAYGFRAYALVYRMLVFIPFAALLAAATALSGKPSKTQMLIIAGAIVLVAVTLELIMGSMMPSGFQVRNLLVSVGIASIAVAAMRIKPKRARGFAG
jgi:glycopeptide antibiotics resistance protein